MKSILVLCIALLSIVGCVSESNQEEKSENPEWVIEAHGLGPIRLNDSLTKAKKIVSQVYEFKEIEHDGFIVVQNGTDLIKVQSKKGDGTIGYIEIYSSKFKTIDGLHCGMKIPEIKKLRSDLRLEKDEMTGQEYFAPHELQEYPNPGGPPNTLNLLYLVSVDGKDLAERYEYEENNGFVSKGEVRDAGEISFFRIYNWW